MAATSAQRSVFFNIFTRTDGERQEACAVLNLSKRAAGRDFSACRPWIRRSPLSCSERTIRALGLSQSKVCNKKKCPIDCAVSPWAGWAKCSKTCGGGKQTTTRKVTRKAKYGGKKCPALKKSQKCHTKPCPVNCKMGAWGSWAACSKSCGGGTKSRKRWFVTCAG